ncbi:MAG: hypothetical protein M0D55_03725 [Elusimicrobiota bacterium]|nr:MAG: hypothetical protein M0D55_03725 [Elusimicrobiota bacterium]
MEHRCLSPWKGAVAGGVIAFAATPSVWAAAPSGFAARVVAAFFWTWILGKIPGLTLKDAALYGLFFGAGAGVLGSPDPVRVAEAAFAWSLASLAISRCYAKACAVPAG